MAVFSKRSLEGSILIDHRNSPGISEEFIRANKLDEKFGAFAVGSGKTVETAITVCHCCQRDVYHTPTRKRERGWCRKHDAYLCDDCNAAIANGMDCIPFSTRMEAYAESVIRGRPLNILLTLKKG